MLNVVLTKIVAFKGDFVGALVYVNNLTFHEYGLSELKLVSPDNVTGDLFAVISRPGCV